MPNQRARLHPETVREPARALEETLARLDGRVGRCGLCRDAEAAAFLLRMTNWLARQQGTEPTTETAPDCPGSGRPVPLAQVGDVVICEVCGGNVGLTPAPVDFANQSRAETQARSDVSWA